MLSKELCKRDIETCRALCFEIQQYVPQGPHATAVLFSDEAHFHLCHTVNKQNFRLENSPFELHEHSFHCPQMTVWCAVAEFGIWGSYFFEEDITVTVNSGQYCRSFLGVPHPLAASLYNIQALDIAQSRKCMTTLTGHLLVLAFILYREIIRSAKSTPTIQWL